MAAPSKLTPQVQQTLVRAISLGSTLKAAAQAAGITYDCLWRWEQEANAGKEPYLSLFKELQKAEGERQIRWLAQIEKVASEGTWTAAAWKLERLYSETYALKHKVDVDVNISLEALDDADLERLAAGPTGPAAHPRQGRARITQEASRTSA